jgi:hypothetical protein
VIAIPAEPTCATLLEKGALAFTVSSTAWRGGLESACRNAVGSVLAMNTGTGGGGKWELLDPEDVSKGVKRTYTNGDACVSSTQQTQSAVFNFVCLPSADDPATVAPTVTFTDLCAPQFTFMTAAACPTDAPNPSVTVGEGGMSTGWALILIIMISVALYLVAGVAYKVRWEGGGGGERRRGGEGCQDDRMMYLL